MYTFPLILVYVERLIVAIFARYARHNLVVGDLLLWLLEPILLGDSSGTSLGLSLDLNGGILVCLQLLGDISLLWGSWWLRWVELEDGALGVGGLDGGWLVGLELLEVKVLDEIGYDNY